MEDNRGRRKESGNGLDSGHGPPDSKADAPFRQADTQLGPADALLERGDARLGPAESERVSGHAMLECSIFHPGHLPE